MEITPVIKDCVLKLLAKKYNTIGHYQNIDTNYIFSGACIDFNTFHAIMYLFEADGLVTDLNLRLVGCNFTMLAKGIEFANSGGYAEIERFKKLEKLYLERKVELLRLELEEFYSVIEVCKCSNPSIAERLIGVAANISTIFGIVMSK